MPASALLEGAGDGLHSRGNGIELCPPLSGCCQLGYSASAVRFRIGKEPAARSEVACGGQGAAHGVALDGSIILLGGYDSEVVLELQFKRE